eukprot:CAMPEP_0194536966 /NCGR_PEP_ID=MMETSP0253-20130528/76073_1 /TAXON_ID=2966 /ORGANISM="Noctiluca scintillans" /LENGTH=108 /DNA_ID=CAMNT_0039382941 /DNA_START=154 /DNA_END=476 /DNA_ORIENTATION=+
MTGPASAGDLPRRTIFRWASFAPRRFQCNLHNSADALTVLGQRSHQGIALRVTLLLLPLRKSVDNVHHELALCVESSADASAQFIPGHVAEVKTIYKDMLWVEPIVDT